MRVLSWALLAIAIMNWIVLIGEIALRFPDNHGGGPACFAYVFGGVLCASVVLWGWTRKLPAKPLAVAALGLLFVWVIDVRNIHVEYIEWTRRGMPGWGEATHSVRW